MRGRFAPSPSGRMHLGNVYSALLSYLSAKKTGGEWILRIEDLDRQRCKKEYSSQLIEDLLWLGLKWDNFSASEGGLSGEFYQSNRDSFYIRAFDLLCEKGLVYDCFCTRADLLSSSAPHASDGKSVYSGKCRNLSESEKSLLYSVRLPAKRIIVEDRTCSFFDGHYGNQNCDLSRDLGDFIIRRSDGNFSYQLAVVVDDALMGVNQVVRGRDLISSTFNQLYLYEKLDFHQLPQFFHLPLLLSADGRRLSKRDKDTDMGFLRENFTSEQLIGKILFLCGCLEKEEKLSLEEAVSAFDWQKVKKEDVVIESQE
ncbi:tRNA glutamyl-Q(34) synthetase GluQRS [uncultured Treponema sp.]|uniref:tRNA glutamyl-Q(34) synthetase GluQRS n=1 Tax=uncultured Treponema sp. TaxID=162155 RepID=UPI0025D92A85|nr:tRNA glutamyl-Q(34) synthetase GluQRS [uncultured Treponema sp.]